ncbi:MAG: threonylcarbamoyl-AMP synthase [Phycisphaeraceae bacterium]|nr:threonylcarbamoyl-AMP synthase [Phycisphaerae bacterium]MBX3393305.1 threonylcarbamoyl-AMP synthase [Phycisphaeraceae bacterium]
MDHGPEEIALAVNRLRSGGLVAFPTETVYGLAADAFDPRAVARVFSAKGRPAHNPLIVHVSGPSMARRVVQNWPEQADRLAASFWPGPLSIVLPAADDLPRIVTSGGPTVAVRCPDHPLTLALIEAYGSPLVGPSANRSGRVSPTTPQHVRASFAGDEVFVLDGGPSSVGIESTVLDLSRDPPIILRPGVITRAEISSVLGVDVAAGPAAGDNPEIPVRSPGMLDQHYAPRARAQLVTASGVAALPPGTVVIGFDTSGEGMAVVMPRDARGYAAALYRALRDADAACPPGGRIAVVVPETGGQDREVWEAVMDRLRRACADRE